MALQRGLVGKQSVVSGNGGKPTNSGEDHNKVQGIWGWNKAKGKIETPHHRLFIKTNEWYDQIIKELLKHTAGLYKK